MKFQMRHSTEPAPSTGKAALDILEAAERPTVQTKPYLPSPGHPGSKAGVPSPLEFDAPIWQAKPFEPSSRRMKRNRVVGVGAPRNVQSAYGRVRTQFLQRLQENGWNTVAITSPTRGAGSTLTAINLAVSIARDYSYTVVLVELDFANPSFRKTLGFRQKQGILDYLLRDSPLNDIVLTPGIERLVIIPAGAPVAHSSALLSSPKLACLIEEIRLRYNDCLVLFDLPCVMSTDHATTLAPFVDCTLLVVEEGETTVNEVRCAIDYLRATNIVGMVVNQSLQLNPDGHVIFP